MFTPDAVGLLSSSGKDIPVASFNNEGTLERIAECDLPVFTTTLKFEKKAMVVLLLLCFLAWPQALEGKRVTIPDELDDVVDDEEDEAWKEWGSKKLTNEQSLPPPPDLSKMELSEIQAEMMKRHVGPSFGFVKLRPGAIRSRDEVPDIAMRWTKVLRTGSIAAKFMAVDINTIMFTLEKGQDTNELKDFILNQQEAYEIKIGENKFRRSGDPPLEDILERHRRGDEL